MPALFAAGVEVHCLRDLIRGGLATALVEIAATSRRSITFDDAAIPLRDDVAAACELLGLGPLHVAREDRFIAFVALAYAEAAVAIPHRHPMSTGARIVGFVNKDTSGNVSCRGVLGVLRAVDMLTGEPLPRIR